MSLPLDVEPPVINGLRLDPRLLESRLVRRCNLDECQAHCCTGGVWIDVGQAAALIRDAQRIRPYLSADRQDELTWFDGAVEADSDYPSGYGMGTRIVEDASHPVGTACVFLLPDRRCALQAAALDQGLHPWTWKPTFCALHPITVTGGRVELDDANEIYQEGGSCQRCSEEAVPLYRLFEDELVLALGADGYAQLVEWAERLADGVRLA